MRLVVADSSAEQVHTAADGAAPAAQTTALKEIHTVFYDNLRSSDTRQVGLFESHTPLPHRSSLAVREFMASQSKEKFIVTLGFEKDDVKHIYATIQGDRVDFSEDCPKATGW